MHQALCIISLSYVNSNWSYGPEMAKLVFDLCDLDLWPLTLTICMDLTRVNGNDSWKFYDDKMMVTYSEKGVTDGRTGRRTDRQVDGLNHSMSWLVAARNPKRAKIITTIPKIRFLRKTELMSRSIERHQIWRINLDLFDLLGHDCKKLVWPTFGCKVGQNDPIAMKLEIYMSRHLLNV